MNFEKRKIFLTLNNLEYSFYYACNQDTTFSDLLEFFTFLVPSLNLCQCYQFQANRDKKKSDENWFTISENEKIVEYADYLNVLKIIKPQKICAHTTQNYFLYSKKRLISFFSQCIEKLNEKKNKEIKALESEVAKLKNKYLFLGQPNYDNPTNFYDLIVHIDSIKDINKGWRIEMNEKGKQNYLKYKSENMIKIGVIGNANKGKSFILSKISRMNLPSGMSVKTEGLSIKYPNLKTYKNRTIALLDSAGLETPVLVESNKNEKNKGRKEENNKKEEDDRNELFKEKCREKLITELFLQNYIIHNSDVLFVIVDCLSFSEQKLLMKIKREIERAKRLKPLYIIHNLKTFTTKMQVVDYIKNTLLKSATFNLEKGIIINTKKEEINAAFKFFEKKKDDQSPDIFHLIYANEHSEAGKYYNPLTLDFIEHIYQNITNTGDFDVIDTIKDRFIEISKEIIEKKEGDENIVKESFDNSLPDKIKLKNEKEIILKQCLIDEVGFSNLKPNGFEPKYNIYKKDDKIIIRVEVPGFCDIDAERIPTSDYYLIRLRGEKIKDREPENIEDNIHNLREYGKFLLDIPLYNKEYKISEDDPEFERKEGVFIIKYKIDKPKGPVKPKFKVDQF